MEASCKQHNRSLQSPRTIALTPPPTFKTLPHSVFLKEVHSPSPPCGFRFCERALPPLPHDDISVLWPIYIVRGIETIPDENPNISTTLRQFSSDFGIDGGFWNNRLLQMVWNGALVNVQLNEPRMQNILYPYTYLTFSGTNRQLCF
ncbi:hypothetical protein AVEN_273238-1 [Araneus ventricosus]|uniref:Uncharacterized protein n=1 Tax=Araneus ventricosus TaxID=182803 RepID=A0A4Y2VUY1_ARAVE|nr:hypothetical protein AVEN_273238-1 [Araneus ventricosus]